MQEVYGVMGGSLKEGVFNMLEGQTHSNSDISPLYTRSLFFLICSIHSVQTVSLVSDETINAICLSVCQKLCCGLNLWLSFFHEADLKTLTFPYNMSNK